MAIAYEQCPKSVSYPASGNLSGDQWKFCKLVAGEVVVCDTLGEASIGVLRNKPEKQGDAALICYANITQVLMGANVAAGVGVTTSAAGAAVAAASGQTVNGRMVEAGTNGARASLEVSKEGELN